ncbi:MAG: PAS domain S-box protein, partial [candidate division Zixibacteria bacterium]|nr:PAS domain S-box protein [candidate division Zixibacteria bacterium]
KLRKTSEALQSIMDSATEEIIITTDQTGTILNWNEGARRLLGYEPEEVINKGSIRIFHTEEYLNSGVMERNLKCMITTGEPLEEEPTYVARGGRTFPVHQIVTPRFDKEGKFTGMLGMARDITERKRAETDRKLLEENLYQSDKMASIGQLAAGVAHEINNPIGFISSNLNTMNKYLWRLIKHFTGDDPNATENRQRIDVIIEDFGDAISESLEGADRVKKIVADLKSFSRVDAGEVEYTDLNEGLETTLNIVWNQLKYTCKIEKEFGDIPQIECFPNRINQVFMNLLVNAGQAIKGKSGLIRIKTWADDDHVHVSIRDNGCGIPKENLPKLFDAFFTTKEVGKGTGLGLSLAYDIVSKHGGTITVDSEVGKGTEFVVTLPLSGIPEPASIPTV